MPSAEPLMHPLTLRFPPEWEGRFHRDYFAKSVKPARLVLGFLLAWQAIYLALLLKRSPIYVYAGLAALLLCVGAFTFSFSGYFRKYLRPIVSAVILLMVLNPLARMLEQNAGSRGSPVTSLLAIVFIMVVASSFARIGFVYSLATSSVTLLIAVAITATYNLVGGFGPYFVLVSSFAATVLSGYLMERYVRREYIQADLLQRERQRSERLLLNVLPAPIADRLKAGGGIIADVYPETTVLFADIVDFTGISARGSAPRNRGHAAIASAGG